MSVHKRCNNVWNDTKTGMVFLVLDASTSRMSEIHFCPWCGEKIEHIKENESVIAHTV